MELDRVLESLLDALEVGVIRVNRSMVVTTASPAAHALLGRPGGAMLGLPLLEATVEPRIESLATVPVSELPLRTELPAPGGGSLAVVIARGPSEDRWVFLGDASEVTRLRRIRTEFVDNLSHELRTPITTIGILAEALSLEAGAPESGIPDRVRDRVARIEVETGHLAQMVGELLDLARVESGVGIDLHDVVDLHGVVVGAIERMQPYARRSSIQLEVEPLAGPLPAIRGDASRLEQVVVNLVHNAVKFSMPGGHVRVRVWSADGGVLVAVQDEGVGIGAADQARLFERFYKADRARTLGRGTGLGLSISRHILEAHGGRISVESSVGRGSTFTFFLPVAAAAD